MSAIVAELGQRGGVRRTKGAQLRSDLSDTYKQFLDSVSTQLPESVPADDQEATAYALLCIAHAAQTFEHLAFTPNPLRLARDAATLALKDR